MRDEGRSGVIVPTGIATDSSTSAFFGDLVSKKRLAQLIDFENREGIFPGVHRSFKFCVLAMGAAERANFAFFLTNATQLDEVERRFTLTADQIARINPNTKTAPVFRSSLKRAYREINSERCLKALAEWVAGYFANVEGRAARDADLIRVLGKSHAWKTALGSSPERFLLEPKTLANGIDMQRETPLDVYNGHRIARHYCQPCDLADRQLLSQMHPSDDVQ